MDSKKKKFQAEVSPAYFPSPEITHFSRTLSVLGPLLGLLGCFASSSGCAVQRAEARCSLLYASGR